MPHGTAITRSVLSDQVKDRLLQAILDGRFPPGSRIAETRVAREFGTSQAPVREALRDLQAVGVIEIIPFHGARVRQPTTDELLEAFTVRCDIECLAARLAIPRLNEADLDELQAYIDRMHAAVAAGDAHAEALADASFHALIVDLSGNATLDRVWQHLEPFSRTYITLVAPGAELDRIADLHEPVLDALRRRDSALASAAIQHHFVELEAMVRLRRVDPPPAAGVQWAPARPSRARRHARRSDHRRRAPAGRSIR